MSGTEGTYAQTADRPTTPSTYLTCSTLLPTLLRARTVIPNWSSTTHTPSLRTKTRCRRSTSLRNRYVMP